MDRQSYLQFEGSESYAPDTVRSSGACAGSLALAFILLSSVVCGCQSAVYYRRNRESGGSGDGQGGVISLCQGSLRPLHSVRIEVPFWASIGNNISILCREFLVSKRFDTYTTLYHKHASKP